MRSTTPRLLLLAAGFLLAAGSGISAVQSGTAGAQNLEITRSTIDGGGAMHSTGGDFELSGTIGQPDAGLMGGGEFGLTGGFWFAVGPGDCNTDGATDLGDYDSFRACLTGPGATPGPDCRCYDLDQDNDVDLTDVAGFQRSFHEE